jgi:CRISPR/Cas system-associated protein Cas5 (RAMP superfamily)
MIKENSSKSKSSVEGGSFKKALSKDYLKFKKKKGLPGNKVSKLRLYGDMLGSLETKVKVNEVEVGIYKKKEAAKADGHCNYTGKSKLPERRFLPDEKHDFTRDIKKKLESIAKDYVDDVGRDVDNDPGLSSLAAAAKLLTKAKK